jgi:hypothetical protein
MSLSPLSTTASSTDPPFLQPRKEYQRPFLPKLTNVPSPTRPTSNHAYKEGLFARSPHRINTFVPEESQIVCSPRKPDTKFEDFKFPPLLRRCQVYSMGAHVYEYYEGGKKDKLISVYGCKIDKCPTCEQFRQEQDFMVNLEESVENNLAL